MQNSTSSTLLVTASLMHEQRFSYQKEKTKNSSERGRRPLVLIHNSPCVLRVDMNPRVQRLWKSEEPILFGGFWLLVFVGNPEKRRSIRLSSCNKPRKPSPGSFFLRAELIVTFSGEERRPEATPPAPRSGLHHPWLPQEDRLSYRESLRDSGVSRTWGRLGDSASSGRSLSSSRPASRFISGTLGVRVFPLRLPPEWAGMDRLPGSTTRLEDGAPAFTPLKGGKRSWVSSDETNTFRCKKNAGCRNCEFLIFKWWIICCRRMWFSVSLRKT